MSAALLKVAKQGFKKTVWTYFPSSWGEWQVYLSALLPIILSSAVTQVSTLLAIMLAGSLGPADTNSAAITGLTQYSNFAILYNAVFGAVLAIMGPALTQNLKTANDKTLQTIMGTIMQMQLCVFAVILLFNLFAAPPIAANITSPEAVAHFKTYSAVVVCAFFFQSLYSVHVSALIAQGKSLIAVLISSLEVATSLIFNLVFMFALKRSVTLIAIATLEASAVTCLAVNLFVYFFHNKLLTHPFVYLARHEIGLASDQRIYTASLYKYLLRKTPALLFSFIWAWEAIAKNLLWAFGDNWSAPDGSPVKSSYALSSYYGLTWICLSFMSSVSQLVPCFVGRQLGEKNFKTAQDHSKKLIGLAGIVGFVSVLLLVIVAVTVPRTDFINVNPQLREIGTSVMLINAFTACFWVHQGLFISFMLAGGKNIFMSLLILMLGVLQIGWQLTVVLLHRYEGAFPDFRLAYFLFTLFEVPASAVYFLLWKKNRWQGRILIA